MNTNSGGDDWNTVYSKLIGIGLFIFYWGSIIAAFIAGWVGRGWYGI